MGTLDFFILSGFNRCLDTDLSNFREVYISLSGQGNPEAAPVHGALDDAAGRGVQADGVLVKIPAEGGIVGFDGPVSFAVGMQLQREGDLAGGGLGNSFVFAHQGFPLSAAAYRSGDYQHRHCGGDP